MAEQATARVLDPHHDAAPAAPNGMLLLETTSLSSGLVKTPAANDASPESPAAANDTLYDASAPQQPAPLANTAAAPNIVAAPSTTQAHRSGVDVRPPHSYTQSTLAPTSEFTRYILLALPARYLFRSIFESAFQNENAYDRIQRPINDWIMKRKVDPLVTKINAVLKEHKVDAYWHNQFASAKHREDGVEYARHYLENDAEGQKLKERITKILDKNGALGKHANNHSIIPYALTRAGKDANGFDHAVTTRGKNELMTAARSNQGHIYYGMALGLSMLGLTASYSRNVYKDMQHLYSEAVAYETGKKPEDVTIYDLFKSENKIVNATTHNFWMKLAERVGLSIPFFLVGKFLPVGLADFTVGLTGFRLLTETWNRKPTMFEDLVAFVNQRINPQNGLGQPITVSDVFDIYQHYCYYNQKEKGFHNVISTNNEEAKNWSESHILFTRIADLMNHSYAYKHTTQYDDHGNVIKVADFLLPKYIYLMGHDLIDATHPDKSLTYVEIANAQGIEAVKQAQKEFAAGKSIEEVQAAHGLKPSAITNLRKLAPAKEVAATTHADSYIPKPTKPETEVAASTLAHDGPLQQTARAV